MKNIILSLLFFSILSSCNNTNEKKHENHGPQKEAPKTKEDSLFNDVMKGHDDAMPKSMKIPNLKKEVQRQIDSISTLPAKAQEAAAPLKAKLENLRNELDYAYFAMDKWMSEFNMDSAKNNMEQRIKYLSEEKLKINQVKEAVLNGLAKADSLLKTKL